MSQKLPILAHFSIWWKMIRFKNLLIILLTQILSRIFLINSQEYSPFWFTDVVFWAICGATICVAAAGYIINDYYDSKIDTINKPDKVLIGKYVHRRGAILVHFSLNFLGLLLGFWANIWVGIVCFLCEFFLWAYSSMLKPTALAGNVMVGFLTAGSLWIFIIPYSNSSHYIGIFGMFALFISIIREIIKDMEDVKGDKEFGCKTLPIIWGIRKTKIILYIFNAILITLLLSTYFTLSFYLVVYFYSVLIPSLLIFIFFIQKADKKADFSFLSNLCKIIMILGVLGMVCV
jgi:4-hydroxybenzoate polyprenyltransferase